MTKFSTHYIWEWFLHQKISSRTTQGALARGLGCKQFHKSGKHSKLLDRSELKLAYTYADSSGNGHRLNVMNFEFIQLFIKLGCQDRILLMKVSLFVYESYAFGLDIVKLFTHA